MPWNSPGCASFSEGCSGVSREEGIFRGLQEGGVSAKTALWRVSAESPGATYDWPWVLSGTPGSVSPNVRWWWYEGKAVSGFHSHASIISQISHRSPSYGMIAFVQAGPPPSPTTHVLTPVLPIFNSQFTSHFPRTPFSMCTHLFCVCCPDAWKLPFHLVLLISPSAPDHEHGGL